MFYKVIYDGKIIDVLDKLICLKYRVKHDRMVLCKEDKAQAILSSDNQHIWHVEGFYDLPVSGYDTVRIEEIDEYDYKRLKALNCWTVEDIIDEVIKNVIVDEDTAMLIESLKRLYINRAIDENKVIELCNAYKISEESKNQILD